MPRSIEIKDGLVTVTETGLAPSGQGEREWTFRSHAEAAKQRGEFETDLSPEQKAALDQAAKR